MKPKKTEVRLLSFGYKYGIPAHADLIFDVRFFTNPFYVPKLKNKTGRSADVKRYVLKQESCPVFLDKSLALLEFMVREYRRNGKHGLVAAFGCTGGRHRSVVIAEAMEKQLKHLKIRATVTHRDEKR